MIIINAFVRFTSLAVQRVHACFCSDGPEPRDEAASASESTSLLPQQRSLTAHYEDFVHSRNALRICFFHASVYYTTTVITFSFVVDQWPIIHSLYFGSVIFTTIGFGDLHPNSRAGENMTIVLALYGIIILGIFIGILGEAIVDSHDKAMKKKRRELRAKVIDTLATDELPSDVLDDTMQEDESEIPLRIEILTILLLEAPIVMVVLVLALLIGHYEGWTPRESVYWVVIAGTTIGFGDYTPEAESMKLACVFFLPFAVAVLGEVLARIASAYMDRKQRKTEQRFLSRSLTLCDLQTMDTNRDGNVNRAEFVTFMLVALQKVSKEDMDGISTLFHRLDRTHTGYLSKHDLVVRDFQGDFQKSLKMNISSFNSDRDES